VFPRWLQNVSSYVPTRWAIDGLDGATWRGLPFDAALAPTLLLLGAPRPASRSRSAVSLGGVAHRAARLSAAPKLSRRRGQTSRPGGSLRLRRHRRRLHARQFDFENQQRTARHIPPGAHAVAELGGTNSCHFEAGFMSTSASCQPFIKLLTASGAARHVAPSCRIPCRREMCRDSEPKPDRRPRRWRARVAGLQDAVLQARCRRGHAFCLRIFLEEFWAAAALSAEAEGAAAR